MPGAVLHLGTTLLCAHGGQAMPIVTNPRVRVSGHPTVMAGTPWTIAGCPFIARRPQPCISATFLTAATRVTSLGVPLLLSDSQATTEPNGAPVMAHLAGARVQAR